MKVLITRSEVDAEPLAALLYARQVETLIDPMISIELIPGTSLDLSGVQALLMTSANGVRAYCANHQNAKFLYFPLVMRRRVRPWGVGLRTFQRRVAMFLIWLNWRNPNYQGTVVHYCMWLEQ